MNAWLEEGLRILNLVVRTPNNQLEMVITIVAVAAVFLIIMWLGGLAFKMPDTNILQRVIAGVLVFVAGLAAATAASVLLSSKMEKGTLLTAILVAAPVVAVLAIGIPLAMLTMRSKYFQTLFCVLLSVAGAWGISLLAETVLGSITAGMKQATKISERKDSTDKVINSGNKTNDDPRDYKIYRSKRDIENQKRDEERAAAEKKAREQAIRDRYK